MKMQDPTMFPLAFDQYGNLIQLVGMRPVTVMDARLHCMPEFETELKVGCTVKVAEYYLDDEASPECASILAIIVEQPEDDEQLVGIEYDNGSIDYVPQDILELV